MFARHPSLVPLAVCALMFVACGGGKPKSPRPLADAAIQSSRKTIIDGCIKEGVFRDVKYGDNPTITVAPRFYSLDFRDKELFCSTVAAHCFKVPKGGRLDTGEVVFLEDSRTGKIIGTYSELGLDLN